MKQLVVQVPEFWHHLPEVQEAFVEWMRSEGLPTHIYWLALDEGFVHIKRWQTEGGFAVLGEDGRVVSIEERVLVDTLPPFEVFDHCCSSRGVPRSLVVSLPSF